ncbi:alpha/beta fold hydrolase [Azohydromonas aeria]|uniref:alpha/beta fold hydrolase n=1 Tax=Azohydromonas aeria TaxID=2590212 RepID=UPI0012F94086|nr:alpha/beta hydrolase [Azohydromonas aeria]
MSLKNKLNVREMGRAGDTDAPTFLLAHGYGCDQTMWYPAAELMHDARCILFDWPGAGQADISAYDHVRHQALPGYADDLTALMEELGIPNLIYVGHSVAASIGALAAVRTPKLFGQLAMLAPSPCFLNELPEYEGGFELEQLNALLRGLAEGQAAWSHAVAPMVMGNTDRPALAQSLEHKFCQMDPDIAVRWAKATFLTDVRPAIAKLKVPTLVLQCRDDALVPPAVGAWLQRNLRISRLVQLQASGHCPQVSEPEEVAQQLLEFRHWRGQQ